MALWVSLDEILHNYNFQMHAALANTVAIGFG